MALVDQLVEEHKRIVAAAKSFTERLPSLGAEEAARTVTQIRDAVLAHVQREETELLAALEKGDAQAQNLARMYRFTMKPVTDQAGQFFQKYCQSGACTDKAALGRDWERLLQALGKRIEVEENQFYPTVRRMNL